MTFGNVYDCYAVIENSARLEGQDRVLFDLDIDPDAFGSTQALHSHSFALMS